MATFGLKNLVKLPISFKSIKGTSIDALLTNKPNCLQKTIVFKDGFSDHHMLAATVLRSTFIKFLPKKVRYRNYKDFSEETFCHKLVQILLQGEMCLSQDPYSKPTEVFSNLLENHDLMKTKTVRGNYVPFMTKKLSKKMIEKSRIRNKYLKWSSRENYQAHRKLKTNRNFLSEKQRETTFKTLIKIQLQQMRSLECCQAIHCK